MEREFERIDLPGGQWWELYTEVTRGMRKVFTAALLRGVRGPMGTLAKAGVNLQDAEAVKDAMLSNIDSIDLGALTQQDDAYLLHGTRAYSYGERVTLDVIDALLEKDVARVLTRMRELYQEGVEPWQGLFQGSVNGVPGGNATAP